ncbi:PAS domain-containing protein [Sphingobacterium deserti]|uniref:histidine kinase n=1 Tax=Sphingobacterium deserti TaxID=1229276 RepID=A0A0B8SZN6_9SPHI|nr:PAS domain-containing protein [Sphingobacterium deserti]KGE13061.1 PAS sensor protein [Sphingobacterium deserti]
MINSPQDILNILQQVPQATAIYDNENLHIAYANQDMLDMWSTTDRVLGTNLGDSFPEFETQGFVGILKEVWRTGETYRANDVPANILLDGIPTTFYFDFEYRALLNENQDTYAILHTAQEVSSRLEAWSAVRKKEMQEAALNEELRSSIEEQRALTEEYMAINEKLSNTVDELSNSYKQLDFALDQSRRAKEASNLGMFDLDVQQDILVWDDRCKELFGVPPESEVSYTRDFVTGLHPDDRQMTLAAVKDAFDRKLTGGRYDIHYRTLSQTNGKITWVHAIGNVYFDEADKPVRFIGTVMDVTESVLSRKLLEDRERKLQDTNEELAATMEELTATMEELTNVNDDLATANIQLRHSEQVNVEVNTNLQTAFEQLSNSERRLNLALTSAKIGIWEFNIATEVVHWDERSRELFGADEKEEIPYQLALQYIYEEDRKAVADAISYAQTPASEGYYDIQFRTVGQMKDSLTWVQAKGRAYFDNENTPVHFSGTILDISDRIQSQQRIDAFNRAIAQSALEQRLIVDAGRIGTFSYNPTTNETFINKHTRQMYGLEDHAEVTSQDLFQHRYTIGDVEQDETIFEVIREESNFDLEFNLQNALGDKKWLRIVGSKIWNEENHNLMAYGVIIDFTAQKMEEKRKLDFLGIVSHELRSPLTSLSGYLQILQVKSKALGNEKFHELIVSANRQSVRMKVLIESFLDIARIGEGKLRLNKTEFYAHELLLNIDQMLQQTVTSHTFDLQTDGEHMVLADRDKIEQVIINFINNAIKYSASGSTITIEAKKQNSNLYIAVTDQGAGIAAEDQQKIFTRFYRVENTYTEAVSGFGIGLYISKEIINLHGGTIGLNSAPGHGSTFWFSIPALGKIE